MNALVFNTTADQLKSSIYGYNSTTGEFVPLLINDNGELIVSMGENSSVTVTGTITVGNSITIANTSLNVNVTDTVNVAGTVTVSNSITIANASLTVTVDNENDINVKINGNTFTSATSEDIFYGVTDTGTGFEQDISTFRTATMFVKNQDTSNAITIALELSPNGTDYFVSPHYEAVGLAPGESIVMAVGVFANYVRLYYDATAGAATFDAYYNAQA